MIRLDFKKVNEIRADFPYLNVRYNGKPIVYLDNGATTQKPRQVIDALTRYYETMNGGPHRGAHYLSMQATECYEGARARVARFLGTNPDQIIFTRGATESLNLLAYTAGLDLVKKDDHILISLLEHHSNLVIWQFITKRNEAVLDYLSLNKNFEVEHDDIEHKLTPKTKIFSITGASNVTGTMPEVEEICKQVKAYNSEIITIVDGAQLVPHQKINVNEYPHVDFIAFSGHKMCAPMGIGVLYGTKSALKSLRAFHYGGDMIEYVYKDHTSFLEAPFRYEAGTQNVGGAYALAAAMDYIDQIGFEDIIEYEKSMMDYCYEEMKKRPYIQTFTNESARRSPVIAFNIKGVHPHDVSSILNEQGIAIRSGHHCAQVFHRELGCHFSCRVSFSFYNTFEEIDFFLDHLEDVRKVFSL